MQTCAGLEGHGFEALSFRVLMIVLGVFVCLKMYLCWLLEVLHSFRHGCVVVNWNLFRAQELVISFVRHIRTHSQVGLSQFYIYLLHIS